MARRKIVAGNWKMNMTPSEAVKLVAELKDLVKSDDVEGQLEGQMDISELSADFGIFDTGNRPLKTTGCNRTGCVLCGFGCHLEKEDEARFVRLKETHPGLYGLLDVIENNGVTYRQAIDWINEHGNMHIRY